MFSWTVNIYRLRWKLNCGECDLGGPWGADSHVVMLNVNIHAVYETTNYFFTERLLSIPIDGHWWIQIKLELPWRLILKQVRSKQKAYRFILLPKKSKCTKAVSGGQNLFSTGNKIFATKKDLYGKHQALWIKCITKSCDPMGTHWEAPTPYPHSAHALVSPTYET